MEKVKSFMLILLAVIVSIYLLIGLSLYLFQDYFLFFPQKLNSNSYSVIKYKDYAIEINVDDIILHGWLISSGCNKLIIYYGGNGDEVSTMIPDMQTLDGYSVLLMNYRGYGLNQGRPSEKALFRDALAIYDSITKQLNISGDNVILMGRSLGSGVAVYVAANREVSKLVLVTPFDSIRNLAKHYFPIFPMSLILKHPFNSIDYTRNITTPSLIIMGSKDRTIPNKYSLNLAKHWQGECRKVLIEGADHNDIVTFPEYWQSVKKYLN